MQMEHAEVICKRRTWLRSTTDKPGTVVLVFNGVLFVSLSKMRETLIEPWRVRAIKRDLPYGACWRSLGSEHKDSTVVWQALASAVCQLQPPCKEVASEWDWKSQDSQQAENEGIVFSNRESERAFASTLLRFHRLYPSDEPPRFVWIRPDLNFISLEDAAPVDAPGVARDLFNIDSPQ